MKMQVPRFFAAAMAVICLSVALSVALAAETSWYDTEGIDGIVDIEEGEFPAEEDSGSLVAGRMEQGPISLEYQVSGGTLVDLTSDEDDYLIYRATVRPGETVSMRVTGTGYNLSDDPDSESTTAVAYVFDAAEEPFEQAIAYPGDPPPTVKCSYTVRETDAEFTLGANVKGTLWSADGEITEITSLTVVVWYTVVDGGATGAAGSASPAETPPESSAQSPAGGSSPEASAGDNGPSRDDSSYIPDGAKDDSFLYLVLGLVFLLAVIATVILIVLLVRRGRRRGGAAINTGQASCSRYSCPSCGAAVSPGDQFCEHCGKPV